MTVTPNNFVTMGESKASELSTSSSRVAAWCRSNWKALLAEFMATTLLVFLGCMACIPLDGFNPQPPMYAAVGYGLIVMINTHVFGHISGAYMNPCITLSAVFWGKLSVSLGIAYFIVQCIGSIFASWLLYNVSPVDTVAEAVCVVQPNESLSLGVSVGVEAILTAVLCWISCAFWDPVNEKLQDSAAILYGLGIVALALAGGPLTGASTNPARTLGPALVTGHWNAHWVYWVGPILGATFAANFYIFVCLDKKQKSIV